MEKAIQTANRIYRVVINGPESTGKTELTQLLANYFNADFVPEYARVFIQSLNRPYNYADVVHIARKQAEMQLSLHSRKSNLIFYDTDLIITKVWFEVVYKKYPDWLDKAIKESAINLYLLCYPDIPWLPDTVRENGGEMRHVLFNRYQEEINSYGFKCQIIKGLGETRISNAIKVVKSAFPEFSHT